MIGRLLVVVLTLAACPAAAQSHRHDMPSPAEPAAQTDAHADHAMPDMTVPAAPAGDAPPSVPATYADRVWGPEAMRASRARLAAEHGGARFTQLHVELAEVAVRDGRDGYRWDAEGWYGGDVDRIVVKSDGGGGFDGAVEADVQALYSRAIGPYFDLQAGIRQDLGDGRSRTYAALGIEGLAPYWLQVDATAFLSDRGEAIAEVTGLYDQRITQRLILQPRLDIDLAAQDSRVIGVGAGLSRIAAGLRLRYEVAREFAPYIGVRWDRSLGRTARYARAAGDDPDSVDVVAGLRFWF